MQDLFKKFIYTSIGLVSITAETLKSTVDKLVEESKLSSEEGKKLVDDFMKNTEDKKDEFESQLKTLVEKIVSNFKFVTESDLDEVMKRVEALEDRKEAKPKTVKKVAPKS
ncbi:MAG: phasin family protein [Thermonemataceae bacterium]